MLWKFRKSVNERSSMPLAGMAICAGALFAVAAAGAWAQPADGGVTLKSAFEAAWARQPEAQSLAARHEAMAARRDAAGSWTAEPATVEISARTDQLNRNQGSRETVLGVAIPLWLPGEQPRAQALADAQSRGTATRADAARLRTAAMVRDAYWAWARARVELALAHDRMSGAQALAADVARRVNAGVLARADQHQADGNVTAAESALAESQSVLTAAAQLFRSLVGAAPHLGGDADAPMEASPRTPASFADLDTAHPQVVDLIAQAEVAKRAAELARIQTRAHPELTLSTTRERGAFGDPYQQSLTLGVRVPFGSDSRYRAKLAEANADALELESQTRLARERVLAELDAARQRVASARQVADANSRRALLARETRGFFEKSFQAGESDLPARLRVELEATEADRHAARARIDYAASISALRQALGLLPE